MAYYRTDDVTFRTLGLGSDDRSKIYIITQDLKNEPSIPPIDGYYYIECEFWNVTHTALFNFTYPSQNITFKSTKYLNPVSASSSGYTVGWSYYSMMDAYGTIITGAVKTTDEGSQYQAAVKSQSTAIY